MSGRRLPIGRWWWAWALLALVVVTSLAVGGAKRPTTGDSDDRLYSLADRLKCLQCVGENVAQSEAPIAREVRDELRRQMRAGRTDDEILNYFVDRYGQRILLTPSASGVGALVWIVPVVVVGAGIAGLALAVARSRRRRTDAEVSDEDRALVDAARRRQAGTGAGEA